MSTTIETIATTILTGAALWAIKEWWDAVKLRRAGRTERSAAEITATGSREARLDARTEAVFARYEMRLSDLEAEVAGLKAEVKTEQENRKLAEVSSDVAHERAGDAEFKMRSLQGKLSILELEISAVSRQAGESAELAESRARHIAELKARIKTLEDQVDTLNRRDTL